MFCPSHVLSHNEITTHCKSAAEASAAASHAVADAMSMITDKSAEQAGDEDSEDLFNPSLFVDEEYGSQSTFEH